MLKEAYEYGVQCAMVDAGLVKESSGLHRALLGGGVGALSGALASGEGNRITGALGGGTLGAIGGATLGHAGFEPAAGLMRMGVNAARQGAKGKALAYGLGGLGTLGASSVALPALMGAAGGKSVSRGVNRSRSPLNP